MIIMLKSNFLFAIVHSWINYLHVNCSVRSWQYWHLTSQHQWNLQSHCHVWVYWCVLYPRPQHIDSHPSPAVDVLLHARPWVPSEPVNKSNSQKFGDFCKYTRWRCGGFLSLFVLLSFRKIGFIARSPRIGTTNLARAYLLFILSPTTRKRASVVQQVFVVHDPDTPWHLHSVPILSFSACENRNKTLLYYTALNMHKVVYAFWHTSPFKLFIKIL